MGEMVERVAKEIYEAFRRERTISGASKWAGPWDAMDEDCHAYFALLAKSAIAAMREPTKAMWNAGKTAEYYFVTDGAGMDGDRMMRGIWQAMIDEALKGQ